MRFVITRLLPNADGRTLRVSDGLSGRPRSRGVARELSRRRLHTWAASLSILLLVAFLIGAPSPALATTAPYTLLGIFAGNSFDDNNTYIVPITGGPEQVEPNPANVATQLPAFTNWAGKGNLIVNTYDYFVGPYAIDPPYDYTAAPNTLLADLNEIWLQGAVPMLSWGRSATLINSGALDGEIKAEALTLKTWLSGNDGTYGEAGCSAPVWQASCDDRRIYFRPFWESNLASYQDWSPCASGGPSAAAFIAAWRHVHDIFTAEGLDNSHVAWVYSVNNFDAPGCSAGDPANMYPGSNYVDWLGIDGYTYSPSDTPASVFGPMVSQLATIDPTKPIGIDETGVDSLFGTSAKNQWISDYFSYLANNNIRMSVWFNQNVDTQAPPCGAGCQSHQWAIFQLATLGVVPSYGDESFTYNDDVGIGGEHTTVPTTHWVGFSAYQAAVQSSSVVGSCGGNSCAPPGHIASTQQFLGQ